MIGYEWVDTFWLCWEYVEISSLLSVTEVQSRRRRDDCAVPTQ